MPNENGLFFTGTAGTGKTYAAVASMIDWLNNRDYYDDALTGVFLECVSANDIARQLVGFVSVPEFFMELRSTFSNDNVTEDDVINRYANVPLLILDDFGAEKMTDYSMQSLYILINRRLNEMRQTIITSNLSLPEIQKIDPRLASRIASYRQIKLLGKDRRIK